MAEIAQSIQEKYPESSSRKYVTAREAIDAVNRFVTSAKGGKYVVRFSLGQRLEHLLLVVTVTVLAVTGLSQAYYNTVVGKFILGWLGGMDSTRQIHHIFAIVLVGQAIQHFGSFISDFFSYFRGSKIWLRWSDVSQFVQTLKYDLGLSKARPLFDRYNFEQKTHYWIFILSMFILGGSGLMQWFPIFTANYLPGWMIPVARAIHHWQAIFTILILLTWHVYHNVLKRFNRSIFSGVLSVDQMEHEHPLELIYLQRASAVVNSTEWPVLIDLSMDEEKKIVEDVSQQEAPETKSESNLEVEITTVQEETISEEQAASTESTDGLVMSGEGQNE